MKKIGVIGGDLRMSVAAHMLAKKGCEVYCYATEKDSRFEDKTVRAGSLEGCVSDSALVILPLPFSRDGKWLNCPSGECAVCLRAIINAVCSPTVIFGGCLDDDFICKCSDAGIKTVDYFESEALQILNVLPTCEGALEIAIKNTQRTLAFSEVFVCGYGRIGELLCEMLHRLGARVTLVSRSEASLSKAKIRGYNCCELINLKREIPRADIFFNTVPSRIITQAELDNFKKDTLIIELASAPGGIDIDYAKKQEIKVISALGLPGKTAPITAGENLADSIYKIAKREGII